MFRFLPGGASSGRQAFVRPILRGVRFSVVAAALASLPFTTPHFFDGARGTVYGVAFAIAVVAWFVWALTERHDRLFTCSVAVLGLTGGVLTGLAEYDLAVGICCVVTATAGIRLKPEHSLMITAETVAAFLIAGLAAKDSGGVLIGYSSAFAGMWALGLTRHESAVRADEAERMLEQVRRARTAETEAAALAERARIAREIHDVLAHSLAAVSVNLQAAEGLLSSLPDESPELTKALECIERAGVFTREGLTEARRAINALRDNTSPLPEQLKALAAQHEAPGDAEVDFDMAGSPRPVPADANLTAFRTAQEALTNARKHSPGEPVRLRLEFAPAEIAVLVTNPLPSRGTTAISMPHDTAIPHDTGESSRPAGPAAGGARPSLASTGGGHGLTGLRERAELSGGTLTAGPADGQWLVCLRIPA